MSINRDERESGKMFTMKFVYMLGIARPNHKMRPVKNPLPSVLAKSFVMRPSR
jgi:hypothetical protein